MLLPIEYLPDVATQFDAAQRQLAPHLLARRWAPPGARRGRRVALVIALSLVSAGMVGAALAPSGTPADLSERIDVRPSDAPRSAA